MATKTTNWVHNWEANLVRYVLGLNTGSLPTGNARISDCTRCTEKKNLGYDGDRTDSPPIHVGGEGASFNGCEPPGGRTRHEKKLTL